MGFRAIEDVEPIEPATQADTTRGRRGFRPIETIEPETPRAALERQPVAPATAAAPERSILASALEAVGGRMGRGVSAALAPLFPGTAAVEVFRRATQERDPMNGSVMQGVVPVAPQNVPRGTSPLPPNFPLKPVAPAPRPTGPAMTAPTGGFQPAASSTLLKELPAMIKTFFGSAVPGAVRLVSDLAAEDGVPGAAALAARSARAVKGVTNERKAIENRLRPGGTSDVLPGTGINDVLALLDDPRAAAAGLGQAGAMAGPVILSMLTRSTVPAMTAMGMQVGPEQYSQYREQGLSPLTSLAGAAAQTAAELGPEKLSLGVMLKTPIGKLMRGDAKSMTQAARYMSRVTGTEIGTEELSTVLGHMVDRGLADPNATTGALVDEMKATAKQMLYQAPATAAISRTARAAPAVARAVEDRIAPERSIAREFEDVINAGPVDTPRAPLVPEGRTGAVPPPAVPPAPDAPPTLDIVDRINALISGTAPQPPAAPEPQGVPTILPEFGGPKPKPAAKGLEYPNVDPSLVDRFSSTIDEDDAEVISSNGLDRKKVMGTIGSFTEALEAVRSQSNVAGKIARFEAPLRGQQADEPDAPDDDPLVRETDETGVEATDDDVMESMREVGIQWGGPDTGARQPVLGVKDEKAFAAFDKGLKRDEGDFMDARGMTKRDVRKTVDELERHFEAGIAGRDWYDYSARRMVEMFNGNTRAAERFAQIIAITSANTAVKPNFTMAMNALRQFANGEPIKVGTGQVNKKIEDLLRRGVQWDGRKTNTFYRNMATRVLGLPEEPGTTQDMHMGNVIFGKPKLADREYTFAEKLTNFLASEYGASPVETQAAVWTSVKAESLVRKMKTQKKYAGMPEREMQTLAMREAAINYGTLVDRLGLNTLPANLDVDKFAGADRGADIEAEGSASDPAEAGAASGRDGGGVADAQRRSNRGAGVGEGQRAAALGVQDRGRVSGGAGRVSQPDADVGETGALEGLPAEIEVAGRGSVTFGPFKPAHDAARAYAKISGIPYAPITTYVKVDPARATRIAGEYDRMQHTPNDPEVRRAYAAMIKETLAQWQVIKRAGLKVSFMREGTPEPYRGTGPRGAILDVIENNHLWVYPTEFGFGTDATFDSADNPLLAMTEEVIDGKARYANDIFRIVHDYFGHIQHGVGFRADGEENAWRSHSAMYSPLARRAMTSETRGQNSWLNFGPHGESNRTAKTEDTIFADQKTGLMPEWVSSEGAADTARNGGWVVLRNKRSAIVLDENRNEVRRFTDKDRGTFTDAALISLARAEAEAGKKHQAWDANAAMDRLDTEHLSAGGWYIVDKKTGESLGEGPWDSQDQAAEFLDAEVGRPERWKIVSRGAAQEAKRPQYLAIRTAGARELGFTHRDELNSIYALSTKQQAILQRHLEELVRRGMPQGVIDGISSWVAFDKGYDGTVQAAYFSKVNVVGINDSLLRLADTTMNGVPGIDDRLVRFLAHEITHAVDGPKIGANGALNSAFEERLKMWVAVENDHVEARGDLAADALNAFNRGGVFGDVLAYPFSYLSNGEMMGYVGQMEIVAQAGALYFSNREEMRTAMPKWFAIMEDVYGTSAEGETDSREGVTLEQARARLFAAIQNEGAGDGGQERLPEQRRAAAGGRAGYVAARGPPGQGVGGAPRNVAQAGGGGGANSGVGAGRSGQSPVQWGVDEPGFRDGLIREWQNNKIDLHRVHDAIEIVAGTKLPEHIDARLAETAYAGKVTARIRQFERNAVDPMLKAIRDSGISVAEVGRFLWARHAPERNVQMARVNGLAPGTANNLSGLYDSPKAAAAAGSPGAANAADIIAAFTPAQRAALNGIAAHVDRVTAATKALLVAEGLEDQSTIDAWSAVYKKYVPLYRDVEESGGGAGQGFVIKGPESKRAMGSDKEAIAIIAAVITQHETAIIRAEKAEVGRHLIRLAEQFPNADFWRVDQPPTKRVINKSTGLVQTVVDPLYKQRDDVYVVKDRDAAGKVVERVLAFNPQSERAMKLSAAMRNLDLVQLSGVTKVVGRVSRFMATLATSWNPVFWTTNFVRDVQTAAVNLQSTALAGHAPQVMANTWRAIGGIASAEFKNGTGKWASLYREFEANGGKTGWLALFDDLVDRQKEIEGMIRAGQRGNLNPLKWAEVTVDVVDKTNTAIENGTRLSAYAEARKMGMSPKAAAVLAKELTVDFNRKGNRASATNAWYMFFNAAVQGNARMIKGLATSRKAQAIVGTFVAFGAALELLNRMIGDRDRDEDGNNPYELIPEHVRQKNLIFMVPGSQHVMLPLPYGFNVFHNAGRMIMETALGASGSQLVTEKRDAITMAGDFAGLLFESFVPFGSTPPFGKNGSFSQWIAPSVLDPIVQHQENKTWYGAPMRPEPLPFGPSKPDHQLFFRSTSDTAKDLTRWLNDMSGGDEIKGGAIDISPTTLVHIFSTVTGGLGRFGLGVFDFSAHAVGRVTGEREAEELPWKNVPFVGKFYGEVDDRDRAGKYYRLNKEATDTLKQFITYQKTGQQEKADAIEEEHPEMIAMGREIADKQFNRDMKDVRKAFREVDQLPRDERAKARKQLASEEAVIMSRALRAYNEAQQGRSR